MTSEVAVGPSSRVIITGGASGIGLAIAKAFAGQGARVCVADVDAAALARLPDVHPSIEGDLCDVSDPVAVERWLVPRLDGWRGVDVLVNSAGIAGPTGTVDRLTVEGWQRCLAITLQSHFLTARLVAPHMRRQSGGCIISISSTAGLFGEGLRTPYAAAKSGVIGLTKSLAIELGPFGVRVNAVCPGPVAGERLNRVAHAGAAAAGVDIGTYVQSFVEGQSIARPVHEDEVAGLCVFLASPAASMITGQAIAIDGHTQTLRLPASRTSADHSEMR